MKPSSLLPSTTPPGTVWLTKAWNSCARPTLLSSASTSLIGWSRLSPSSSEASLLPFKDQRHRSFWWSSITRSPRNFDAVLGLYRTNKLHLAAGVCVQVGFHISDFWSFLLSFSPSRTFARNWSTGVWMIYTWWYIKVNTNQFLTCQVLIHRDEIYPSNVRYSIIMWCPCYTIM